MVDAEAVEKTREERRAYAESLLAELKAGADFADLARAKSDDKDSAVKGGSLGYFTRGSMVKPFEETAFLSLIHISEPTRPTRASRMPSSA